MGHLTVVAQQQKRKLQQILDKIYDLKELYFVLQLVILFGEHA